jgi:formamidopyrimidine-DNA glycosylase
MPELPDVEGFKRMLARNGLRKRIAQVIVSDARILGKLSARTFASRLQGVRLVAVRASRQHLMAKLDGGGWLTLHFGMTGALQLSATQQRTAFHQGASGFRWRFGSVAYINKRMIGHVGLAEDAADFIAAEDLGLMRLIGASISLPSKQRCSASSVRPNRF